MKAKVTTIIFFISSIIIFSGCDEDWHNCITGTGDKETEIRNFTEVIKGIELNIDGRLFLKQGDENEIKIEAQGNILDNIQTDVIDGKLRIDFDECVRKHSGIKIVATIPYIERIDLNGSADIYSDTLKIDDLIVDIDGSGNAYLYIIKDTAATYSEVETIIDGSGNIEYRGAIDKHMINIDGSGDIEAYGLDTDISDIDIDGSGNCKVTVFEDLIVRIGGSGDVYVKGDPTNRDVKISGSGKVYYR